MRRIDASAHVFVQETEAEMTDSSVSRNPPSLQKLCSDRQTPVTKSNKTVSQFLELAGPRGVRQEISGADEWLLM